MYIKPRGSARSKVSHPPCKSIDRKRSNLGIYHISSIRSIDLFPNITAQTTLRQSAHPPSSITILPSVMSSSTSVTSQSYQTQQQQHRPLLPRSQISSLFLPPLLIPAPQPQPQQLSTHPYQSSRKSHIQSTHQYTHPAPPTTT